MNTGYFGSFLQSFLVYLPIIYGYIASYRLRKYYTVLHHHATLSAPPLFIKRVYICSTNGDLSTQHRIITQHKFDERGFSATRCSDNGCYLAFWDCEAYIVYDSFQCVWIVFKVYIFKFYSLTFFFRSRFQSLLSIFIIHAMYLIDTLKAYLNILHRIKETHQLFHW